MDYKVTIHNRTNPKSISIENEFMSILCTKSKIRDVEVSTEVNNTNCGSIKIMLKDNSTMNFNDCRFVFR